VIGDAALLRIRVRRVAGHAGAAVRVLIRAAEAAGRLRLRAEILNADARDQVHAVHSAGHLARGSGEELLAVVVVVSTVVVVVELVTVVVGGASVVVGPPGGDSHVHAAVHVTPLAQLPPAGSHCSPFGPSTRPSPQIERLAVKGFAFPPLVLKRPAITLQSGEAILASRRPAPALPQDGHFVVSLVKRLLALMRPATARQPLRTEIRPCPSIVIESTDPVLAPWTSGLFPASTRNRPAGHGVAGAFLAHPSSA